jgi:hypothetical protein
LEGDDVSDSKETPIIPIHQWMNGGDEVLVVRFVPKDGKSYGGFQHPMTVGETVTAPDWKADCTCGGGIHAWPWAVGLGEGKDCDWSAVWQVYGVKPKDIMQGASDLVGKIKFRTGILRFLGSWDQAANFVLSGQMAWVHQAASGAASATGERGAASATGERGAASATGWRGAASATGLSGAASATGWSGAASATGERGAASATGWSGAASATGKYGTACALGIEGKASAALGNFLVIAEWKYINCAWKRVAMGLAKVDGKKIKADTFYTLKDGKFVEVQ